MFFADILLKKYVNENIDKTALVKHETTKFNFSKEDFTYSGHTFLSRDAFPPGVLPTKRHVMKRILHLRNFRTFNAANDIAKEIYDR